MLVVLGEALTQVNALKCPLGQGFNHVIPRPGPRMSRRHGARSRADSVMAGPNMTPRLGRQGFAQRCGARGAAPQLAPRLRRATPDQAGSGGRHERRSDVMEAGGGIRSSATSVCSVRSLVAPARGVSTIMRGTRRSSRAPAMRHRRTARQPSVAAQRRGPALRRHDDAAGARLTPRLAVITSQQHLTQPFAAPKATKMAPRPFAIMTTKHCFARSD